MSALHAALGSGLLGAGVLMTVVGRMWPIHGRHRAHRGVREEWVPAHVLVPALTPAAGWPRPAFRYCVECRATVPVVIHHDRAHRCDAYGHITVHTAGSAQ